MRKSRKPKETPEQLLERLNKNIKTKEQQEEVKKAQEEYINERMRFVKEYNEKTERIANEIVSIANREQLTLGWTKRIFNLILEKIEAENPVTVQEISLL